VMDMGTKLGSGLGGDSDSGSGGLSGGGPSGGLSGAGPGDNIGSGVSSRKRRYSDLCRMEDFLLAMKTTTMNHYSSPDQSYFH
jgi:hypothetical protein